VLCKLQHWCDTSQASLDPCGTGGRILSQIIVLNIYVLTNCVFYRSS
jgi:hypothetical protein